VRLSDGGDGVKDSLTLADCTVPIPLRCMHCDHPLSPASPLEQFGSYVVVECLKCHCMSPFQLEKSA
jgi:hypothetical protein